MIRVNGYDYNASVAYPIEKIVASIVTEESYSEIFNNVKDADEISIVNNDVVVATYACVFNGIERISGGYRVEFNRAPMTAGEVENLLITVNQQGEQITAQANTIEHQAQIISAQATQIQQQGQQISQQGDAITRHGTTLTTQGTTIEEQGTAIEGHTEALAGNATELDDILDAITELGDLVAELLARNDENEEEVE